MKTIIFKKNSKYLLLIMLIASQTIYSMQNINAQNENGDTQLHDAVEESNLPRVKNLLHDGADSNIQNKSGYTPIYIAIYNASRKAPEPIHLRRIEILQALLDHPQTDPNIATNYGPALFYAVARGKEYPVQALLNHPRTNPTITNNVGQNAAEFAKQRKEEVMQNMIQQAIDNYFQNN